MVSKGFVVWTLLGDYIDQIEVSSFSIRNV